jgi:hypothetical protein
MGMKGALEVKEALTSIRGIKGSCIDFSTLPGAAFLALDTELVRAKMGVNYSKTQLVNSFAVRRNGLDRWRASNSCRLL